MPGRSLIGNESMRAVWGLEASGDSGVVKEHIRKIRQKLQGIAGQGLYRNSLGGGLSMEAIKFRGLWSSFVLYVINYISFCNSFIRFDNLGLCSAADDFAARFQPGLSHDPAQRCRW